MPNESTGTIPFTYNGETYHTWYKVVGNLTSGTRPLVVLHGGPGISHHYLLPHAELAASSNIPVIIYDQLGIGQSSHVEGKPAQFWSVELFMDELDNVLRHFGISDNYDLIGHSWGGMLAATYASRRPHAGLKHLILSSAPASMKLYESSTNRLLELLPDDIKETLKKHEKEETTDDPEYQKGMELFYNKFVCTLQPWPEYLVESFAKMDEDPTVYRTMIGASEFFVTGTLKTWSVTDSLTKISCPTLLINGENDTVQDFTMEPFFRDIPRVKWISFGKSSHMPMYEEKERYFQVLTQFLTS
ncbi:proline-specific peptidase [Heliocybe sulcata]|uniref:Proline-specific peptidase n=1 Tax=Heliocybe sulcata TaxID=5364 RepID=A0A5C3MWQ2_9AGAM|nr:proline-specific peptidase [Heliocybe sulcata]